MLDEPDHLAAVDEGQVSVAAEARAQRLAGARTRRRARRSAMSGRGPARRLSSATRARSQLGERVRRAREASPRLAVVDAGDAAETLAVDDVDVAAGRVGNRAHAPRDALRAPRRARASRRTRGSSRRARRAAVAVLEALEEQRRFEGAGDDLTDAERRSAGTRRSRATGGRRRRAGRRRGRRRRAVRTMLATRAGLRVEAPLVVAQTRVVGARDHERHALSRAPPPCSGRERGRAAGRRSPRRTRRRRR